MAPRRRTPKQPREQRLKSVYFDSLTKRIVKLRKLSQDDQECASCMEQMHEPVRLHDRHYLCKECAE